jgi:hypothetical protein
MECEPESDFPYIYTASAVAKAEPRNANPADSKNIILTSMHIWQMVVTIDIETCFPNMLEIF